MNTRQNHSLRATSSQRGLASLAIAAVVVGSLALAPQSTWADIIPIFADMSNSTSGLGDFSGTLEYFVESSDHHEDEGRLIITLINESDPDNGGFITGFLFNIDSTDELAEAELEEALHNFKEIESKKKRNGQPFGKEFDAGAGLSGEFQGGGKPDKGIAVGTNGVFEFEIEAEDAGDLTASSFLGGPFAFNFIVRFRGFENGGSDKVPVVPLPASGAAMALLAAGLVSRRQRRGLD